MPRAPEAATLFDWPRREAVRRIEQRRQALIEQLANAKPRTERYFGLRAQLRELTIEELRIDLGGGDAG